MKFAVVWPDSMLQLLSSQYQRARADGFGGQFMEAILAIDRELENDPFAKSESREAGDRIIVEPPASITFRIDEDDHRIYTVDLGYSRPRRS